MEQDELSRLREEAARILKDVRAGTHPQDIRDAGQALNGKWDQDFPTALLKLVVDDGNMIIVLRNALSCAGDSLIRAHVENAELREALGPLARQAALCGNASPEMIIGLIGGVENALRRKDADRAARALASTSDIPADEAEGAKPVMLCICGKVLETPRDYAAHCKEAPDHFTHSETTLDRKDGK